MYHRYLPCGGVFDVTVRTVFLVFHAGMGVMLLEEEREFLDSVKV